MIPSTRIVALVLLALSRLAAADPAAHQSRQDRPISLGTSGGGIDDHSARFCCSGTLGAVVMHQGQLSILSNNHVLAGPVTSPTGLQPASQPGSVDSHCVIHPADLVGDLAQFVEISFTDSNTVDAAVAHARAGTVRDDGSILEVGVPSSAPAAARFGLRVKKSGRTSGLTQGVVLGTNATIMVRYPAACGSLRGNMARFTGQVLIIGRPLTVPFSQPGDSGSLVVEDVATCPHPVGLLFAGGLLTTFANPIASVLTSLGATLVGCPAPGTSVADELPDGYAATDRKTLLAMAMQESHTEELLAIPGVVGTGIGRSPVDRRTVVQVYVERSTSRVRRRIPAALGPLRTQVMRVGRVVAFGCPRDAR